MHTLPPPPSRAIGSSYSKQLFVTSNSVISIPIISVWQWGVGMWFSGFLISVTYNLRLRTSIMYFILRNWIQALAYQFSGGSFCFDADISLHPYHSGSRHDISSWSRFLSQITTLWLWFVMLMTRNSTPDTLGNSTFVGPGHTVATGESPLFIFKIQKISTESRHS